MTRRSKPTFLTAFTIPTLLIWPAVVVMSIGTASATPNGSEGDRVWDLSPLIADAAAWERERDWLFERVETVGALENDATISPQALADVLDAAYELRARATRFALYGYLSSDADTSSELNRLYSEVGADLENRALGAVAFLKPAIIELGTETAARWLEEEPRLERHRRRINQILHDAPYTLDSQAESVLETATRWPQQSSSIFGQLHRSDFDWATVRLSTGEEVLANRSSYSRRRVLAGEDRRDVATAYFDRLLAYEDLFALIYAARVEADAALARHRGFDDGMESTWFLRDGMPIGSHRVVIDVARAHLDTLHRFVELRSRALGLESPRYIDLYAPPEHLRSEIPLEEAIETAVLALGSLDPAFGEAAREISDKPWAHLEPSPNKSFTYAIWPSVNGSPPYFFYSYNGTMDGSRRLAGGMALQAAFASQPEGGTPSTRDDPGIYANGLIYVGDIAHDQYVVAQSASTDERVANLIHSLDLLWEHFFRWVLVSELDHKIQERIEAGGRPTGREVSTWYQELLEDYYGAEKGLIEIEHRDGAEWMGFSVPFYSFEHQFWPAAVALGARVVEAVEEGDALVQERFWRALGRGELDRTYPLLLEMGIDMTQPEPYEAVIRRMDSLLDQLEGALATR